MIEKAINKSKIQLLQRGGKKLVGGIDSSIHNKSILSLNSKIQYNIQSSSQSYIYNDNASKVEISKEALEKLDIEKKINSNTLNYSDPDILRETGCDSIEQLQYIQSHGFCSKNIEEFRSYVKNYHFLPMFASMGEAGYLLNFDFDEVMNNLDLDELININEQLSGQKTAQEKLKVFSDIFDKLAKSSNLSSNVSNELSNISNLFQKLAEKADKNKVTQYSSDLLIRLMKETKQEQGYLVSKNEDQVKQNNL